MSDDPLENVLNLEDRFYQEGYQQGSEDGVRAGRIEGRSLGLERGFDKFLESGRLHGRAIVWANRSPNLSAGTQVAAAAAATTSTTTPTSAGLRTDGVLCPENGAHTGDSSRPPARQRLPALPASSRLDKNITILHALVEPETLSTENTDEAVNDFDDRIKRAQGKAKVIERAIGEGPGRSQSSQEPHS